MIIHNQHRLWANKRRERVGVNGRLLHQSLPRLGLYHQPESLGLLNSTRRGLTGGGEVFLSGLQLLTLVLSNVLV